MSVLYQYFQYGQSAVALVTSKDGGVSVLVLRPNEKRFLLDNRLYTNLLLNKEEDASTLTREGFITLVNQIGVTAPRKFFSSKFFENKLISFSNGDKITLLEFNHKSQIDGSVLVKLEQLLDFALVIDKDLPAGEVFKFVSGLPSSLSSNHTLLQ